MGKVAKVSRLVVIFAVAGRLCCTVLRAAFTSCRVWNMSTDQSKKRLTSAEPRLVFERTVTSPGTLFTALSIGLVIVTSICSTGITPLSTPMTTRGKLVSGKTEIGTRNAAQTPAMVRAKTKKKTVRVERASQKEEDSGAAISLCPQPRLQPLPW